MKKAFTLIELVIVVTIVSVLSGIILFSVTKYMSSGKDASLSANLATLVPIGEVYYNGNGNSYTNFCDPQQNSALKNIILQLPKRGGTTVCSSADNLDSSSWTSILNPAGVCCNVSQDGTSWAACSTKFSNTLNAHCVDSKGLRVEILARSCFLAIKNGLYSKCDF